MMNIDLPINSQPSPSGGTAPAGSIVLERIRSGGIIAILRGDFRGAEVDVGETLLQAGVLAVEVTLNSPHPLEQIRNLSQAMPGRMAVGAGTVRTPAEVEATAASGAEFIVSPNRDVAV